MKVMSIKSTTNMTSLIMHIFPVLIIFLTINLSHQQQLNQYQHSSFSGNSRLKISSLIRIQDDEPLMMVPIKISNLSMASFKNVDIVPESRLFSVYFDLVDQPLKKKQSQEFISDPNNTIAAMNTTGPTQIEIVTSNQTIDANINVTDTNLNPSNQVEIVNTTTEEPVSVSPVATTNQDSNNNESVTPTTIKPILDPQPPVASKIIRQGADIFCGEANKKGNSSDQLVQTRIVGGSKSVPGEFPFQVRLNIMSKRGSGICGGVILDDRHILTAAHCTTACNSRQLTTATIETDGIHATVGDHSIRFEDGEMKVEIEKIIPHEKYDACNFYANDHDIAILRTKDVIQYKFTNDGYGSVNRPCLPVRNQVYREGEPVIVSGWGVTRENSGSLSNVLRYVQVPVVSTSRCKETYGSRVTNDHICAGFVSGGKDSCQGDSGGPLVRIMDNRYQLVGIVSFGYGCGQPLAPGVYTKVSSYMDWVQSNIFSSY